MSSRGTSDFLRSLLRRLQHSSSSSISRRMMSSSTAATLMMTTARHIPVVRPAPVAQPPQLHRTFSSAAQGAGFWSDAGGVHPPGATSATTQHQPYNFHQDATLNSFQFHNHTNGGVIHQNDATAGGGGSSPREYYYQQYHQYGYTGAGGREGGGANNSGTAQDNSHDDDGDNVFWAIGMVLVLLGANALAIWCERNMTSNESLLQGLGTLNSSNTTERIVDNTTTKSLVNSSSATSSLRSSMSRRASERDSPGNGTDMDPSMTSSPRRRTTRIVHFKWNS